MKVSTPFQSLRETVQRIAGLCRTEGGDCLSNDHDLVSLWTVSCVTTDSNVTCQTDSNIPKFRSVEISNSSSVLAMNGCIHSSNTTLGLSAISRYEQLVAIYVSKISHGNNANS